MLCDYKISYKDENGLWVKKSCKNEAVNKITTASFSWATKLYNYNTLHTCNYHLKKLEEKDIKIIQQEKL